MYTTNTTHTLIDTNALSCFDFTLPAKSVYPIDRVIDISNPEDINDPLVELNEWLELECKKYCYQLEKGEKTGFYHLQGRIHLKVRVRLSTLINRCNKKSFFKGIHFSPTSDVNKSNDFYVMKEETRIAGPWMDKKSRKIDLENDKFIPDRIKNIILFEAQTKMLNIPFDPRKIDLWFDPYGNNGKSFFVDYAICFKNAIYIPPLKDYKEICQYLYCRIMACPDPRNPKLIVIDMPRAMKKDRLRDFYSGVESIKDGRVFDTRYSGKFVMFNTPTIIIISNILPKLKYLSLDRWRFWTSDDVETSNGIIKDLVPINVHDTFEQELRSKPEYTKIRNRDGTITYKKVLQYTDIDLSVPQNKPQQLSPKRIPLTLNVMKNN